jgi:hypothetical protein
MLGFDGHVYDAIVSEQPELTVCQVIREVVNVQLISFIQEFSETDNKNIQKHLIIMDFAKAFDKVPHRRLLYKLNY